MTDAMKPLGISTWQLLAAAPMHEAGARLFVDVSRSLASPAGRAGLLGMAGKSDPLTGDALATLIAREFIPLAPAATPAAPAGPPPAPAPASPIETDPAIVTELIAGGLASIAKLNRDIAGISGPALFDFIVEDVKELKRVSFDPRGIQALMAGMEAAWWLNANIETWLGEKNAADTLAQSVPNNVTSEMGLDLLRVADLIRPHRPVVAFLQSAERDDFLDDLAALEGGRESRDGIAGWLERYGMRGVGEIDITRPRWRERPTALLPMLLGNLRNFAPGEADRRFAQGLRAATDKEEELVARLRALPDGATKVEDTKRMIERLRTFSGYREYPKYFIVNRTFAWRLAMLKEAERLVQDRVIADRDDVFYLTFDEFREVVRTRAIDHRLVAARRNAFRVNEALRPPRVLTSEGEMVAGAYRRDDLPPGALIGITVSAGTVKGRARIIFDPAKAGLEPGDILVTPFTDPSWTPLFVGIRGLVTEVGGQMTHGAVIAREYGLPAVVGVENATRLIKDGQHIRVHGTSGFIELLQ
jgi:pyruvate,water dikinase